MSSTALTQGQERGGGRDPEPRSARTAPELKEKLGQSFLGIVAMTRRQGSSPADGPVPTHLSVHQMVSLKGHTL